MIIIHKYNIIVITERQYEMKKNENQILFTLSVGAVIALFCIIRECSYPLVWNTELMRWVFISKTEDKLASNIAYSYIAAYIFYIMQVYIPKIINKRKVIPILSSKINELNVKVLEFSFIINQITYREMDGLCIRRENIPLYYKVINSQKTSIKKISSVNTLVEMLNYIEKLYSQLLDKFVIYNLDMNILKLWEEFPLEYYRQIVKIIELNENRQIPIVVNGIIEKDVKILHQVSKYFHTNFRIEFEKTDDEEIIARYEDAAVQSGLPEIDLALTLTDKAGTN